MNSLAHWPSSQSQVSAVTLAREMAALTKATLAPPPFPDGAATGNGQPVIVVPGFLALDMSTARLREFLLRQGFDPHSWTGGLNIGPMRNVVRDIEQQVMTLRDATGRKVSLIGVSLGGTTAREIAKTCPDAIARVITLVSPIHLPVVTPLAPLAQAASLFWDDEGLRGLGALSEPPPVPLTALFSRDDGIVDWQATVPPSDDRVEIVEITGPHMTVCSNPVVHRIIADRLARDQ